MSLTAMKQALEALQAAPPSWRAPEAQAALRTAIEQAEKQEPVYYEVRMRIRGNTHNENNGWGWGFWESCSKNAAADYENSQDPQWEYEVRRLYTTPPAAPVQEPSTRACRSCGGSGERDTGIAESPIAICKPCAGTGQITTPPAAQRQWVGLTDEDVTTSHPYSVTRDKGCFHAGADWANTWLREKNGGQA